MSEIELTATLRKEIGKGAASRLRRSGQIPCVLYGTDEKTVCLSANSRELNKLLAESHSLIKLKYEGNSQNTVVKEVQYHPLKGDIIHVDFQRVKAGQEIHIAVPLKFIGVAPGVKSGGIFQELKGELNITCLPKNLPDELEIDISSLEIGDSIHVKDVSFENIVINDELDSTICSIAIPKKVVEPVEEEAEEGEEEEEQEEPEVITAKPSETEEKEEG